MLGSSVSCKGGGMLEIIAQTVEDAVAAERGGATQIDLKADLLEGGVTPSAGMVERVCASVGIDVVVMVRPRVDRMVVSPDDIRIMCHDIGLSGDRGAAGFLLGALTADNELDLHAILSFKDAADGLPLHFHMGWELSRDHARTLEQMIELGFRSARTTGGFGPSAKVTEGIEGARRFCELAAGRIDLFLGGGVQAGNVAMLVRETVIIHAHAGTGVRTPVVASGAVMEEKVRQLRTALDEAVSQLQNN